LHRLGVSDEVLLHGAVDRLMGPYREAGVAMPPTRPLAQLERGADLAGRLLIAPPAAHRSRGLGRFAKAQNGFVSGWMAVRGARRRRGYGRGFVMSDHADWAGLLQSVTGSQAQQVYVTHGQSNVLARYLQEVEGISAEPLEGHFEAERFDEEEAAPASPEAAAI
jgi:putative mRNA 3-end processing factor